MAEYPHLLGIDDGPFDKTNDRKVDLVGAMVEGNSLLEGVSIHSMPVDYHPVTPLYARWIQNMRWFPSLQGVVIGGITVAGLGIIDLASLSQELKLPVLSVTRSPTTDGDLINALESAGYEKRIPLVRETAPSQKIQEGLYAAFEGTDFKTAKQLVLSSLQKSTMPEPLRIAHLVATAVTEGESKGNV